MKVNFIVNILKKIKYIGLMNQKAMSLFKVGERDTPLEILLKAERAVEVLK
jgi:hypothetical protein